MAEHFVKVDDGKEVRRNLLESSKICIQILKSEHKVAQIREQKAALITEVRGGLKELNFLLNTLEKDLPVLTKKELEEMCPPPPKEPKPKKTAVKKAAKKKSSGKKKAEPPKKVSKAERLEKSLDLIERRLQKL